jgi:hypothetical protein
MPLLRSRPATVGQRCLINGSQTDPATDHSQLRHTPQSTASRTPAIMTAGTWVICEYSASVGGTGACGHTPCNWRLLTLTHTHAHPDTHAHAPTHPRNSNPDRAHAEHHEVVMKPVEVLHDAHGTTVSCFALVVDALLRSCSPPIQPPRRQPRLVSREVGRLGTVGSQRLAHRLDPLYFLCQMHTRSALHLHTVPTHMPTTHTRHAWPQINLDSTRVCLGNACGVGWVGYGASGGGRRDIDWSIPGYTVPLHSRQTSQ